MCEDNKIWWVEHCETVPSRTFVYVSPNRQNVCYCDSDLPYHYPNVSPQVRTPGSQSPSFIRTRIFYTTLFPTPKVTLRGCQSMWDETTTGTPRGYSTTTDRSVPGTRGVGPLCPNARAHVDSKDVCSWRVGIRGSKSRSFSVPVGAPRPLCVGSILSLFTR